MSMRGLAFWVAMLWHGAGLAGASPPPTEPATPYFESVGADDIPRGVVPAMAQDRAGFLWIATGDGLVRYDGYRFQAQELAGARPAERNMGWVRTLLAGRDGRVWIGTETRGLAVYDPQQDRIRLVRPAEAAAAPLPTLRALAEDRGGAIWTGSIGGGVERFDPASGQVRRVALPDPRVEALLVDRAGRLWIGSWSGLLRLDPGQREAVPMLDSELAGRRITALHEDRQGQVWIGSQHGDLVVVDPADGQPHRLGAVPDRRITALESVSSFADLPGGQV